MRGLMQDVPLTVEMVLRRARRARTVVTATPDGPDVRSWAEIADRAARLRAALPRLGVRPGDRVATFCRNTHRHVELILGIPAAGAVVHPLNIRLHRDQLEHIVGDAGDRVLFADADVAGLTDRVIGMDEYEELIASVEPDHSPVAAGEDDALALCYTSGTTGDPKGVLFSHRSTVLHALGLLMVDSHAVSREDVLMPAATSCSPATATTRATSPGSSRSSASPRPPRCRPSGTTSSRCSPTIPCRRCASC